MMLFTLCCFETGSQKYIYPLATLICTLIANHINLVQRQEAEHILLDLLERQEHNPVMLYNLGLIYAEDRQYTQAMKYARSALSFGQGPFGAASTLLALILSGRYTFSPSISTAIQIISHVYASFITKEICTVLVMLGC